MRGLIGFPTMSIQTQSGSSSLQCLLHINGIAIKIFISHYLLLTNQNFTHSVLLLTDHHRSREWNPGSEGNCYGEKKPIEEETYWGSGSDIPTMRMVERVLRGLGPKVSVINITQLSEYRKDGHPSVYRKFWEPLNDDRLKNPASYSDCIHWCVPGVPDVWNQLLFHFL